MTDHTQQYQLTSEVEQRRLDELTQRDHGSVANLTQEIGMCRFLVERNLSNPSLCNALLSTCAKLCASHQMAMERAGITLPRETILKICMGVVKLVAEEFCDLPGSQERLDRAINRIDTVFAELVPLQPEPLRITDQRGTL